VTSVVSVVLVEDNEDVAQALQRVLQREGYAVTHAATGQDGIDAILGEQPDVVVLDLTLPDIDGLDVCQRVREDGFEGGILMVTARSDELDRVLGLDYGADDYLAKPYGLAEMQARVRALARRAARQGGAGIATPAGRDSAGVPDAAAPASAPTTGGGAPPGSPAEAGALDVDTRSRRVRVGGEEIALTPKEFDLLALLHAMAGAVLTREDLMSQVWDEHWFGSTKTLDVTIGRLRQKLQQAGANAEVVTVRGVGFRLETG